MPTIPGGKILGGMGGRIWISDADSLPPDAVNNPLFVNDDQNANAPNTLEVAQWQVQRITHLAECPTTGSWGAINRRVVAFDYHWAASIPVDQDNMPDVVLASYAQAPQDYDSANITVALAFLLGNVEENPEAQVMGLTSQDQKYYWSPSAYMQVAGFVLDSSRDVIRVNVNGMGNSRMYLIPDELNSANAYYKWLQDNNTVGS